MSKPIIPISQSIYDAKGDQLTYSTWLKINRALASASGAGGSTDLGPISGLLASTSGYLDGKITSTSGTLVNYVDNISGALNSKITTLSGYIENNFAKKGYYSKNSLVLTSGWYYNNMWVGLGIVAPSGAILESSLNINGLVYHLDNWYDAGGNIKPGYRGTTTSTNGYSVNYQTNSIRWNYIIQNDGFNINDNDDVVLYYYTE